MPDRIHTPPPTYTAMVASAASLFQMQPASVVPSEWHGRAWDFFDSVGELWIAAQIYGAALGRARLVAAKPPTPGGKPSIIKDGPAAEAVAQIAGSVDGQSQMLWSVGVNMIVPGICVIVGSTDDDVVSWNVYAPDAIRTTKIKRRGRAEPDKIQKVEIRTGPNSWKELVGDTLTIPVWRQHPRRNWEPDSPARHTLDSLAEIELLSRHIISTGLSRVVANGLLLYPEEAAFKPREGAVDSKLDPFTQELVEAGQAALTNPGSPGAAFPLPVKVSKELIEYFKHLEFATPFDERVLELRESAIRRFATGMDLPAEQFLGMSDATHWNAWQISEDTIRVHIIPMLQRIAHALTIGYLWPTLGVDQSDNPDVVVWVDTSDLIVRPDRSQDAFQLYDRIEINGSALRRETGFSEEDKPGGKELEDMVAKKLLGTSSSAEAAAQLTTGFESRNDTERQGQPYSKPEDEETRRPGPTDPNAEQTTPGNASALMAACDGLMYRALEKVGNRLRSHTAKQRQSNPQFDCPPTTMHCCIDGPVSFQLLNKLVESPWGDRLLEVADRHSISADDLDKALTPYLRDLVANKREYQYADLAVILMDLTAVAA